MAGISSLGLDGAHGPGTYGAREHYVRVSSYASWIDAVLAAPPEGHFVNPPAPRMSGARRGPAGPGQPPQGVVQLETIGLLVADRAGQVRMVGRIDERYPAALLDAGIRPPAVVVRLNDTAVTSAKVLQEAYAALLAGQRFTLVFEHQGRTHTFDLTK